MEIYSIYVNDIIVTGNSNQCIHEVITQFNSHFSLKDMKKLHYFLGLEITHTTDGSLLLF
ncbi:hypothetical protein AHAS_Ahas06G0200300 [Arachis hypogaea]